MGIPAFYRWLVEKYPRTAKKAIEEKPVEVNGVRVPIDTSRPNPNRVEFDNLYLDMNGIIHPCFHPEGLPAPKTYEEVFKAVFKYIDRIFAIVRPRKLLYLAIDGVAPRAKMNQQRSRRFRAAKDAASGALVTESLRSGFGSEEKLALLENCKMDSNVITPGTEFMDLLSSALRYYLHLRMNEDLGWQGVKVILSDANVPGEGEHKIMSYIRLQRNLPGFDPNTRHCLYGLDADLIMLALATHEIHFTILREDVRKADLNKKTMKHGKNSSWMNRQKKNRHSKQMEVACKNLEDYILRQKFQFLNLWVLRDYLEQDMSIPNSIVILDLERLIDDFVFMCVFAGNDFLPQVPSLEISEGAIDLLMKVYKTEFVEMGGYLTNSFEVNLKRVEHFLQAVGSHECAVFKKRSQTKRNKKTWVQVFSNCKLVSNSLKLPCAELTTQSGSLGSSLKPVTTPVCQNPQKLPTNMEVQRSTNCTSGGGITIAVKIKLGEVGWKERFYAEKFEAKTEDDFKRIQRHAVFKYIEGACWVMRYYYEGVCSWQWFYPYHYAPFASDFYGLDQFEIKFTLGEPFKPFDQLMGVLPAASAHALPLFYRKLMIDTSSPILDFYPTDFELDRNGKCHPWQAICKLPFIEESRLLSEIAKVEHTLTDEERQRNSLGLDVLFVHISHPLAGNIFSFCKQMGDHQKLLEAIVEQKIDAKFSDGMNGYIYISDKPALPVEISSPIQGMKMIAKNEVICVLYKYPSFHTHISRLLEGVILPKKPVNGYRIQRPDILCHEIAVSEHSFSEKPCPKSASGPRLAKLAHQLVSESNLTKQQETLRCMEHGDHIGAHGLKDTKTEVRSQKRQQEKCQKKGIGDRLKERKKFEGDSVPNNNVEKFDSCIPRDLCEVVEDHAGVDGLREINTEVKFRKRKRRFKTRKQTAAEGKSNVEKFGSCFLSEQSGSDVMHAGADGLEEIKTEVKSRKRRRRSKKMKQTLGDFVTNNNVKKLGSLVLRERSEGDVKHAGGDVNHAGVDGLTEIKIEVRSRKRRRRSKTRKQTAAEGIANNNAGKLGSCFLSEQSGRDGKHAGVDGLEEMKTEEKKQTLGDGVTNNNVEKLGRLVCKEQSEGDIKHTGADGLEGIKTEVQPGKRKRRSKKRKQSAGDAVANNNVEKLESCFLKPEGR